MTHSEISTTARRAGWLLSGLIILLLAADAATAALAPQMLAAEAASTGWSAGQLPGVGMLIAICVVAYAMPRTSVLGAILITGFLGGAICTHVRVGELGTPPQIACLLLGIGAWGGLWLRDARVRRAFAIGN